MAAVFCLHCDTSGILHKKAPSWSIWTFVCFSTSLDLLCCMNDDTPKVGWKYSTSRRLQLLEASVGYGCICPLRTSWLKSPFDMGWSSLAPPVST